MNGLVVIVFVMLMLFCWNGMADCRGCCSQHGGVVCSDGVTLCRDGSPLSAKCEAKGCNKCGRGPSKKKGKESNGS